MTSRLGSVFPFLLVLVDLQYEGESCPAPARRRRAPVRVGGGGAARPPGASPPSVLGRPGREPETPRPDLGLSPPQGGGRRPVPGLSGGEVQGAAGVAEEPGRRGRREAGRRLVGTAEPGRLSGPGLAWDPRSAPGAPDQRCWEEAVKVARGEASLALEFRGLEGTVSCWMLEVSNRHPTPLWVVSRSC